MRHIFRHLLHFVLLIFLSSPVSIASSRETIDLDGVWNFATDPNDKGEAQEWFKTNLPQLQNVWNIIEKERVTGYEHRAPNKKQKKTEQTATEKQTKNEECLLKFDKIIKIDTEKYVN